MYVANKLKKHHPQIAYERDVRSADIYLSIIDKRIEVKSSIIKEDDYWDWSFGFKQINNHKFDFCVLIRFDGKGKISKEFVLTYEELKNHPLKRPETLAGTNTYIMFSPNYKNTEEYKEKSAHFELELNTNPQKYEKRWDRIQ